MSPPPKVPPVYKPTPPRFFAPAVFRPKEINAAQLKPANNFRLETRPAPPVYCPQQSGASAPLAAPLLIQRVSVPSVAKALKPALMAAPPPFRTPDKTTLPVVQRIRNNSQPGHHPAVAMELMRPPASLSATEAAASRLTITLQPLLPGQTPRLRSLAQRRTIQRMNEPRYPSRERRTPQEGERALEERFEAERRERAAREKEQQRLADLAKQERLALPPVAHPGRTFLDEYAINIHGAYDWGGRGSQATTAVGLLTNETTGWNRYQVAPQRVMSDMRDYAETKYGEILTASHFTSSTPPDSNIHAEMWLLYWATKQGYALKRIGVSKKICPNCQYVLNKAKVAYDPAWADDVVRDWRDPWNYYGEKNPFT